MPARVASADETSACERETIDAGTQSSELMRRAGNRAAEFIRRRFPDEIRHGVVVYAGPGNNGGDGWVVADALARAGCGVSVVEVGEAKSAEARAARDSALNTAGVHAGGSSSECGLIVDALLGTGSSGMPRGAIADAIADIERLASERIKVVSLDLPTGLDATTGEHDGALRADATVTFGVLKRGHTIARDLCGEISVADIGLIRSGTMKTLPELVDRSWVEKRIPPIPSSAHKGTRKRLAVVGGGKGMAGAAILAGEGALRSGIGLLRIVCGEESEVSVHAGIPQAIVHVWPRTAEDIRKLVENVDCIALGPGFGRSDQTRDIIERILLAWSGPVVLDADALNDFAGDTESLGKLLAQRSAVLTPHPTELSRLIGTTTDDVLSHRFEIGSDLAQRTGAAVLLKGSPTVIFSPSGRRMVVASGTAALATGGSGDVLTGIIGTMLAQMTSTDEASLSAASCGAFIHGRASELCRFVRGVTLDDVLHALPLAWSERAHDLPEGFLAELESHS